jgi:hypothetical protein
MLAGVIRLGNALQLSGLGVYDFCMELFSAHAVPDETSARLYQALLQGLYVTAASTMAMADLGLLPGWELAFRLAPN